MSVKCVLLSIFFETDSSMLVERNKAPRGLELVNAFRVGRHSPTDLVELAKEIQLVRIF